MSTFTQRACRCPACGATQTRRIAAALNGGRAPAARAALLDGSFQRQPCDACGRPFTVEDPLIYSDLGRGQLVQVAARRDLPRWPALEAEVAASAARVLTGPDAPASAAPLVVRLRVRLVFGLAALREKLLAWDGGLDDVDLELLKLIAARQEGVPLAHAATLRLIRMAPAHALFVDDAATSWTVPRDEPALANLRAAGLGEVRAALAAGPYVDLARLLRVG
jgi:hypothetical protein